MLTIRQKVKIAWKILFLTKENIEMDEIIGGYKVCDMIKSGIDCDNAYNSRTGCENNAEYCLSRTHLLIETVTDDHVHLCTSCARESLGKTHEFR